MNKSSSLENFASVTKLSKIKAEAIGILAAGENKNLTLKDKNTYSHTSWMRAIQEKDWDEVQALVDLEVDVCTRDKNGYTPLLYAAYIGSVEAINILTAGKKKSPLLEDKNIDGNTPLMLAVIRKHWDAVKALITLGADRQTKYEDGDTPLLYVAYIGSVEGINILTAGEKKSPLLEEQDSDGNTPLMLAVKEQHWDAVEALVDLGANIRIRSNDDNTPLLYAAKFGSVEGINILTTKKRNNSILEDRNSDGATALMRAAMSQNKTVFKTLVCLGANIYAADDHGDTPVTCAIYWACQGKLSYMKILKKYAALELKVANEERMFKEILEWNPKGNFVLIDAINEKQWDRVQTLLFSYDNTTSIKKAFLSRHLKKIGIKEFSAEKNTGTKKFLLPKELREHVEKMIKEAAEQNKIPGWHDLPSDGLTATRKIYISNTKQAFLLNKNLEIGKGSFGIVYITQNVLTGKWLCLKTFKKAKHLTEQEIAILKAEGMYFADHNTGGQDEDCFIGELIHGETLKKIIEEYHFSFEQAFALIVSLVEAYLSLHSKNYVHRDIKPANIIVDQDQLKCVAIDFGVSQQVNSNHNHAGTYKYMSLETLQDFPPQFKDDIYAIGLVAGEILSSSMPVSLIPLELPQEREEHNDAMSEMQEQLGKKDSAQKIHKKISPIVLGTLSSDYQQEHELFSEEIALCTLIYTMTGPSEQRPESLSDILGNLYRIRINHIAEKMCDFPFKGDYNITLHTLYNKRALLMHAPRALDDLEMFLLRAVDTKPKKRPSLLEMQQYLQQLDLMLTLKQELNTAIRQGSTPLFSILKASQNTLPTSNQQRISHTFN